jgi:hypothetical protein
MKITIAKKSGLITLKVDGIEKAIFKNDSIEIDKTIKNLLDITEILIRLKTDENETI